MSVTNIHCSLKGCSEPAVYKIAARWADGVFSELKSYGFSCADHLGAAFRGSEARRSDYATTPGESLGEIQIYRWEQGKRDSQLVRLTGLEENYRS